MSRFNLTGLDPQRAEELRRFAAYTNMTLGQTVAFLMLSYRMGHPVEWSELEEWEKHYGDWPQKRSARHTSSL